MKKLIPIALLFLAVSLLGYAGWQHLESTKTQEVSDEQIALRPELPEMPDGSSASASDLPLMDFTTVQSKHPEIIGWIVVDGLGINYPLTQGTDNQYYLTHSAENKKNKLGAIFMDHRVSKNFSDSYSVIYGHNMKSGKMFGQLAKMKEKATFDKVTAGTLYTPEKTYRLQIFATVVAGSKSDFYNYAFPDQASIEAQLQMIRQYAKQYRDIGVSTKDKFIALSTCSYEYKNARTLVIAKLQG
jgi:sortase B